MESLVQDARYAIRSLLRSPGFTAAAILTLALGIGATTAIMTVVNGVLLKPADFADVDRLAMIWETDRNSGTTREPSSIPDYTDFRARSRQLSALAAFSPVEMNVTSRTGDPERLAALAVTREYFSTVGLVPVAGRTFTADEDRPGGPRSVIISEDLWERLFRRDPSAIGGTLRLNDNDWTIAGVMPRGADFGVLQVLGAAAYQRGFADRGGRPQVDLWVPARLDPAASRGNHPIFVLGRLAPGVDVTGAQAEMTTITAELERTYRETNVARGAHVEALPDVVFGGVRTAMVLLVVAVAMVLLVACTNVANLLMVRVANRAREVTVRTALGAGAGRLAQQFAVEGFLLVGAGATLGMFLAYSAVDLLRAIAPATIPRAGDIRVDGGVLVVTALVSAAIAAVFGLLPTIQARRMNVQAALHEEGSRGAAGGRRQRALRSTLVVAELAMATTLMVGAGLLIRSLWLLQDVNPGFDAHGVLKAEFQLPASRYPQDFARFPNWPAQQRFIADVQARLAAAPGVESVALATANPMDAGFTSSIRVVGREAEAHDWPEPSIRTVSASYFTTMRVAVHAGRAFEASDDAGAPPMVIVNETARARYFAGREAIGSEINLWGANRRVIGVVGDEHFKGLAASAPPAVYMPIGQAPSTSAVLVRMRGNAAAAAPLVRQVLHDVDPQLPLFGVEPLEDTIRGTLAQRRFTMLVLGGFAAAAVMLAMIGVYGVLTYAVAQRTREIGIRVALGADLGRVRRLVVGDGAWLTACGLAIGLVGAFALTGLMRSLLFGVGPRDPVTFVGTASMLGAVALAACWLPARRAARVDPMVALRVE